MYDLIIVGAGPAGIFTALEMIKKGSKQKIIMVEKGQAVENRHCPKDKTKKCVNCKPYCHITTGFSGAGAFSDGKLSLSYEVGGDLPTLITPELAQRLTRPNLSGLRCGRAYRGAGQRRGAEGDPQARHSGGTETGGLPHPPHGYGKGTGYLLRH